MKLIDSILLHRLPHLLTDAISPVIYCQGPYCYYYADHRGMCIGKSYSQDTIRHGKAGKRQAVEQGTLQSHRDGHNVVEDRM